MRKDIINMHAAMQKIKNPINVLDELPEASNSSDKYKKQQANLKTVYRSSKNSGVGTHPDPQTGEVTYYNKAHQSYDRKTGLKNTTGSFKGGKYVLNNS